MKATVYSKPECPWCVKAKELLDSRSIPYTELLFGKDFSKDDLKTVIGERPLTVPQVIIDDKLIGGYDALRVWMNAE